MLLLIFTGSAVTPEPDTSQQFGPYDFFVDRVPGPVVFDIPRDDEEVLLMFAQFVASQRVH